MHPEVQMNQPGNCPKCGMKLVVKKVKASPSPSRQNKLPVSKDTTKQMPMKMGNKDTMQMASPQAKQQGQPVTYTCPMHPEIHAAKPGNCPKCGMRLVKEKAGVLPPVSHQHDSMQMP
jgi:DNA-directed RNA polymerase subunit RPC12/RpoP